MEDAATPRPRLRGAQGQAPPDRRPGNLPALPLLRPLLLPLPTRRSRQRGAAMAASGGEAPVGAEGDGTGRRDRPLRGAEPQRGGRRVAAAVLSPAVCGAVARREPQREQLRRPEGVPGEGCQGVYHTRTHTHKHNTTYAQTNAPHKHNIPQLTHHTIPQHGTRTTRTLLHQALSIVGANSPLCVCVR